VTSLRVPRRNTRRTLVPGVECACTRHAPHFRRAQPSFSFGNDGPLSGCTRFRCWRSAATRPGSPCPRGSRAAIHPPEHWQIAASASCVLDKTFGHPISKLTLSMNIPRSNELRISESQCLNPALARRTSIDVPQLRTHREIASGRTIRNRCLVVSM
jgi:hypothetical protein